MTKTTGAATRSATWPLVVSILIAVAGLPAYTLLLDVPWLRSTGIVAYALAAFGLILAIIFGRGARGKLGRIAIGANAFVLAFCFFVFFQLLSVPAPAAVADQLRVAPDFTAPNQESRPVSLAATLRQGPALLVFYRGHW